MESKLDKVLENMVARQETLGALVANNQGLCLVAKGDIDPNLSGLAMAIAQEAAKLNPKSKESPTICLYTDTNKRCYIKNNGQITAVVVKQNVAATTTAAAAPGPGPAPATAGGGN